MEKQWRNLAKHDCLCQSAFLSHLWWRLKSKNLHLVWIKEILSFVLSHFFLVLSFPLFFFAYKSISIQTKNYAFVYQNPTQKITFCVSVFSVSCFINFVNQRRTPLYMAKRNWWREKKNVTFQLSLVSVFAIIRKIMRK